MAKKINIADITAYLFWVIPCVAGALFGEYISNPQALGLDFAITYLTITSLL
jgi:predicted branched-subunit amino acid permease